MGNSPGPDPRSAVPPSSGGATAPPAVSAASSSVWDAEKVAWPGVRFRKYKYLFVRTLQHLDPTSTQF